MKLIYSITYKHAPRIVPYVISHIVVGTFLQIASISVLQIDGLIGKTNATFHVHLDTIYFVLEGLQRSQLACASNRHLKNERTSS